MKQLKMGVVGGGGAFFFHSNGVKNSPYIKYVAIYDANFAHAKKMAARYRENEMTAYETLDEMLDSDIDAVLVMVPHLYHEEIVVRCANKGKHVLCEKPMGITVEACRNMIAAAKQNNVKLMVAENHRFLPAHTCVHDLVAQGAVGQVTLVRAYEGVNEIPGLSESGFWKGDPIKAGGGALMDMAAHKFAALEYILGSKCEKVTCVLAKQAINLPDKAEDNALAIAHFENGAIAEIIVSFTQMTPPFNSLEIYGTEGSIFEDHAKEKPVKIYSYSDVMGENQQMWFEPEVEHAPFPDYYPISVRYTDEHFAKSVLEDKEPEFTMEQSMSAIECILAGYLSHIEQRPVERAEILKMADEGKTMTILERLAESIPINKNLPEVKQVEAVGFRKEAAQRVMQKYDLDLLIASSPINVYYTTGLPVLHSAPNPILMALANQYPYLGLVRRRGESTVVHWNVFVSANELCWADDSVGIESPEDVQCALRQKIRKWGFAKKRIGVESTIPKYVLDVLSEEKVDAQIVVADDAFRELRIIKTDTEIEYITKATQITETAILKCAEIVKVGTTDNELLQLGKQVMLEEGASDWDHLTLTIGDSDPEAPGTGRAAKAGEILRIDYGATYKGYVADENYHVVIGDVPKEAKEHVDALIEFQAYFEERIKPGVSMKELGEEAIEWYKKRYPQGMAFCIGHSIGLECEDQHLFGAFGVLDTTFEKNMVFEIEAWEKYGGALVGVEDCYVVTEDGCKKITTLNKKIHSIK